MTKTPRANWQKRLDDIGFHFHSMDGLYWREDYAYEFTAAQIDVIDDASLEMHQLHKTVLDDLLKRGDLDDFGWSMAVWEGIYASHRAAEPSFYGRFDWAYDGVQPPKLLEYNADTPTSVIESSLAQWHWLQDVHPEHDQFNMLHEKMVERWRTLKASLPASPIYFLGVYDNEEEAATLDYLNEMAAQAGCQTLWLDMKDVGFHEETGQFRDLIEREIQVAFKLYPWEWMMREAFGKHIATAKTRWLEPMWKMPWASKAFLAHLWRAAPNHPNLLPAYFSAEPFGQQPYVKKPFCSREGTGISLHNTAYAVDLPQAEETDGFVYQAFHELPKFGEAWTMIGSWIVGDETAGIGIREDATPVTRDTSHFVPHYFVE